MTIEKNIILTSEQIRQKTKRIAYQIYENNSDENEIVLAGISRNGFIFANEIKIQLENISSIKVILCEVFIDKKNLLSEISTSLKTEDYINKSIVLVDDVLNSGATLIYGIKHFLNVPLKQFKTAVLINRNHKKFPVKADFKGMSLSTTLQEHVTVEFDGNNTTAYLM